MELQHPCDEIHYRVALRYEVRDLDKPSCFDIIIKLDSCSVQYCDSFSVSTPNESEIRATVLNRRKVNYT